MKKLCLMILVSFLFSGVCFAKNYYALVEILIKNDSGPAFIMNTVTKVPDEESCARILSPMSELKEKYVVRTDCVSGEQWDKLLADTFADKPTDSLYISYKDASGYEARINSKVLVGTNFSPSGQLVDPSPQTTIAWALAMVDTLEQGGIKDAKIIYPRKHK
jgi:hypothetical protein